MNVNMIAAKATTAAAATAIASVLGWKGVMALAWLAMMAIDYLSGTAAAMKNGEWCSETARNGLWHKGGMILVVTVAAVADMALTVFFANMAMGFVWPDAALPLVLAWYILTEIGSILENAVKLGAAVPGWLIKVLKAGLKAVDNVGEDFVSEEGEEQK